MTGNHVRKIAVIPFRDAAVLSLTDVILPPIRIQIAGRIRFIIAQKLSGVSKACRNAIARRERLTVGAAAFQQVNLAAVADETVVNVRPEKRPVMIAVSCPGKFAAIRARNARYVTNVSRQRVVHIPVLTLPYRDAVRAQPRIVRRQEPVWIRRFVIRAHRTHSASTIRIPVRFPAA